MNLQQLKTKLVAAAMVAVTIPVVAQVEVNYEKYPDYAPPTRGDKTLMIRKGDATKTRPVRVNNATNKHFPTIFNQDGGSCGSASRISYMFTYEINALRNADASEPENIYPSHFTWLLTNSGSSKDQMAIANGIPNIEVYGGRTYSALFGNQDCADNDFGWMQGYDKWYSAMFNRLGKTTNFPMSVETEEGREAVKNWLWNHNGDEDFAAGGICGIGVASGGTWLRIPNTAKNRELGVNNMYYVGAWGKQVDHALTIVGYDDEIEFDLDGNGVSGEKEKDEVGAWIIANSWGSSWCNSGFIYCPYKNAVTRANSTDYYWPEVYHIRKNYRPIRTMKIEMEYSKRSELMLSAGISSDINATTPEKIVNFEHFKYAGDGDGENGDALMPMLGRWKDGIHYEPMEFGYDLTDLSAGFDTRKPLKYFFVIQSKVSASGNGKVHKCSILDYEFDENGVEFPCDIPEGGVKIKTLGSKTYISVVVTGEPLNVPRNAMLEAGKLTWDVPALSTYELLGYNIYNGAQLVKRLEKDVTSFDTGDVTSYTLAAVYDINGKEAESTRVTPTVVTAFQGAVPEKNNVHGFQTSGFEIKDLFNEVLPTATIEFWLNPTTCVDYNQQMGPGWAENFMLHTTSSSQLVVGWNTGARIESAANALAARKWHHVAVVVNGNTMTAYVDGENVGECTSGINGIGGFGSLVVGGTTSATAINGSMDEFRVWNTVRTQSQIRSMMYYEVADAANNPDLLAYINMNEDENGKLFDVKGHEVVTLEGRHRTIANTTLLVDKRELVSSFELPEAPYYSNSSLGIKNTSSANAIKFLWEADGKQYGVQHPDIVFDGTGEKTISLTVYDGLGNSAKSEQKLTVESLPLPVAGFKAAETATVGERISFINTTTPLTGSFEWLMPGAEVESVKTVNAAATYNEPGFYTVTLKATNAAGTSEYSKTITVGNVTPDVDFKIEPSVLHKGGTVKLFDQSKYMPTKWHWIVSDRYHHYVSTEQNFEMKMDEPGIYKVSLEASNHVGTGLGTRGNAIVVCNADSKTGLNFRGEKTEIVTFKNPLTLSTTRAFTMDWWMNAKKNVTASHAIGGTMSDMLICSLGDGSLSFSMGGTVYTSNATFFKVGEWHHYALVFDKGNLHLYRDGESIETIYTRFKSQFPTMPETFTFGGSQGAMNAVLDEFRIWNTALTREQIISYANAPIEDVKAAEREHALVLYYQFNQSSGDVQDATSNANNGVRSGFGPEGDAWSSSLGAFCLSMTELDDFAATYLKNYKKPFLHTGTSVNSSVKICMGLQQNSEQSPWNIENPVVNGNITTGFYVNTNEGDALALTLKEYDFEAEVADHKLYQTITLPAGHYVFGVKQKVAMQDDNSYIVVAEGNTIPDTEDITEALASAKFTEGEVSFTVSKETEVTVGLLMNTRGYTNLIIESFYLAKKITNDDFAWSDIENVTEEQSVIKVNVKGSEVEFCTEAARRVTVYNVYGAVVADEVVDGVLRLSLPRGIYLIEGTKFIVR